MPMAMTSVINDLKCLSISSGQDKDIAFIISYQYAAKHGFEKRAKILALNFSYQYFYASKLKYVFSNTVKPFINVVLQSECFLF